MSTLALMAKTPVPHVTFGIFNLAWPNIVFWILVVAIFAIGVYARIPEFMESDAETRHGGSKQ